MRFGHSRPCANPHPIVPDIFVPYSAAYSILLLYSFREPASYVLLAISIAIGAVLLARYNPYNGNRIGEPRRGLALGLSFGMGAGALGLLFDYKSQSHFSIAVGVFALLVCIILFMKYLEYSAGSNTHEAKE